MSVLYTNNATTTLASGISDSATSITVASGTGALFPTISGSDYFNVTLTDSSKHIEIVKVTARSGDVLTVTRAQEGTSARAWLASDILELRLTKNTLDQLKIDAVSGYASASSLSSHTSNTSNPHSVTKAQVGLTNVEDKSSATIRSEITSSNVTTALGYTPYNSTNPAGYTTNTGTVTGVTGTAPIVSSGGTAPAISISAATTSAAGSMSAADKTKLDGIATGATANTGTVTSVGGTGSYGGLTLSGTVTSSGNLTLGGTPTGTWPISVSGSSASCTGNATTASYLPTLYAGGVQSNPQVYFNQSIGLRVAMTGIPSAWCDTLWINGYSGGDVKSMCALHTARNGTPRMWISTQNCDATSYGTTYQFLTEYNYNSYAPTLTGTGASGTWPISISGNADTLDGYHAASFLTSVPAATSSTLGGVKVSLSGTTLTITTT